MTIAPNLGTPQPSLTRRTQDSGYMRPSVSDDSNDGLRITAGGGVVIYHQGRRGPAATNKKSAQHDGRGGRLA